MLSEDAFDLAYALRLHIGSDSVGVGPDTPKLLALVDSMMPSEVLRAITELERLGFIAVERAIAAANRPGPKELRGIVGVTVLELLQSYFDRLDL